MEAVFTFGPADVGEDLGRLAEAVGPATLDRGPHRPDDLAWLLYTGGTTGVPKAAMLPDRAVVQMAMSVAVGWDLPKEIRYLACAPISHAASMLDHPDAPRRRHGCAAAGLRPGRLAGRGRRAKASRSACWCRR